MFFDKKHYVELANKRLENLFLAVNKNFFKNKTVLETGCGYGYIGQKLEELGAIVTSIDARNEHIDIVKKRYPLRQSFVIDLDAQNLDALKKFDIVISFGLLYHLSNPQFFLEGVGKIAPVLYLESCTCNSSENICKVVNEPKGFDQAYSKIGSRPSPLWIENTLKKVGFTSIKDISNVIANCPGNIFDWQYNVDYGNVNLRKMYVAEK